MGKNLLCLNKAKKFKKSKGTKEIGTIYARRSYSCG